MIGMLGNAYPWVKAAHLIFVIFWMAGLVHAAALSRLSSGSPGRVGGGGSPEAALWVEREAKIRTIIMTPAMIVVWVLGLVLGANAGLFSGCKRAWLAAHAKLLLVLVLTSYHGWAVGYGKKLAAGKPTLTGRQLRLINEVPAAARDFHCDLGNRPAVLKSLAEACEP